MIDVGMRSTYVASWHAAQMMVRAGQRADRHHLGLGRGALLSTAPAYGAHKAAQDKLAADMAVDFAGTGVAAAVGLDGRAGDRPAAGMIASDPEKYGYLAECSKRLNLPAM